MKTINKIFVGVGLISIAGLHSCSDFEDINVNPLETTIESTKPEYFLNSSVNASQLDPSEGERIYYYNWGDAARAFGDVGFLSVGLYDDSFISNYYFPPISKAISHAILAIKEAEKRMDTEPFYKNVYNFSRIWRAFLIGQFTDSFGPYALDSGEGNNPTFNSVKDVYDFILKDLSSAVKGIDTSIEATESQAKCDNCYGFDAEKWLRFGNSLRMRFSMRLTNTEMADFAREEFQDACKDGKYIESLNQMLAFKSHNAWNKYCNPYSRSFNLQALSSTMANLLTNLGGIDVSAQRPGLAAYTKPNDYLGIKYDKHFLANTDNPTKQYWLDGIPEKLDPRALKMFWIPGDYDAENVVENNMKSQTPNKNGEALLLKTDGINEDIKIKGAYTWNGVPVGASSKWSPNVVAKNELITKAEGIRTCYPLWGSNYCTGGEVGLSKIVIFGAWESYFLLAEAAVRGWSTPISDKIAYEEGIKASFEYFGLSSDCLNNYLDSEDYNRVGTSVKYNHTAEPTSFPAYYINGYTNVRENVEYKYPDASKILYSGKKLNDHLTKIITQKYLAQVPYVVLEAWSDHRRLGLPFFDMVANESVMTGSEMTEYKPNSWEAGQSNKYYPQRMRYPLSLLTSDEEEYNHALELLGGGNNCMVPLWWAKKDK